MCPKIHQNVKNADKKSQIMFSDWFLKNQILLKKVDI